MSDYNSGSHVIFTLVSEEPTKINEISVELGALVLLMWPSLFLCYEGW